MSIIPMNHPDKGDAGRLARVQSARTVIFSSLISSLRTQMQVDYPSYSYITTATLAAQVTEAISSRFAVGQLPTLTITDMTAGVGGNVLDFARHFGLVRCIEIDPLRFSYLVHNLLTTGLMHRTICYRADSLTLIREGICTQDVIFFDPPWGGPGYKREIRLRLQFSGLPLEMVCSSLLDHCRLLVVKLPTNYDPNHWSRYLGEIPIQTVRLSSFQLLLAPGKL